MSLYITMPTVSKPGKDVEKRERIVKRIFQGELFEKRIEKRTVQKAAASN